MKGFFYDRHRGTTPYKAYYNGMCIYGATDRLSAGITHNVLYALPFPSGDGGAVDELVTWVCQTVVFSSLLRLGFYESTGITNYPTNQVSGTEVEIDVATGDGNQGILTIGSIAASLTPHSMYFIVALTNADRGGDHFRSTGPRWQWYGTPNLINSGAYLHYSPFTYGPLPDPFPAGADWNNNPDVPLICTHFAAV